MNFRRKKIYLTDCETPQQGPDILDIVLSGLRNVHELMPAQRHISRGWHRVLPPGRYRGAEPEGCLPFQPELLRRGCNIHHEAFRSERSLANTRNHLPTPFNLKPLKLSSNLRSQLLYPAGSELPLYNKAPSRG